MSFALAASKVNVALAPASKATVSSKKVSFAAPARSFMVWYVDSRPLARGIAASCPPCLPFRPVLSMRGGAWSRSRLPGPVGARLLYLHLRICNAAVDFHNITSKIFSGLLVVSVHSY